MAGPDGTVSLDVIPNLAGASAEIQQWGKGLKPVDVKVTVDGAAPAVKADVATAQKALDTLNTSKARSEIAKLQSQGQAFAKAPFGDAQIPTGFASSNVRTSPSQGASSPVTTPALSGAATEIERVAASSASSVAPVAKLGGSMRELASNSGQVAQAITPLVGDLGGLTNGFTALASGAVPAVAAIEVAVAGFTSAWNQLQEQTKSGVDLFAQVDPTKFQAAFDPTQPSRFFTEMEKIRRSLGQIDDLGGFNALGQNGTAKVAEEDLKRFKQELDTVSTDQARRALDFLADDLRKFESEGLLAQGTTADLYAHLGDREAADRAVAGIDDVAQHLDRFGFVLDDTKGRLAQYADSLGKAFDPIQGAISAQDAVTAGQQRIIDARQKLTEAESNSSEALTAARDQLVRADADLTKAIEENAKQQQDALDRLLDAQDRLAAAREKGAALASGGEAVPGTIDRSVSRDIGAAERDVAKAQRDLEAARAGSDQITAAKQRIADAQKRVNDEEAKVGPNSERARAAQKELNDAEAAMPALLIANEEAAAKLGDELDKHPQAVQASIDKVKEWQRQGLISNDVADQWLQKLYLIAAASKQINTSAPSAKDTTDAEHSAQRPVTGGANAAPPKQGPVSQQAGENLGLYPVIRNGQYVNGTVQTDKQGRKWKFDAGQRKWIPQFDTGGLVGPAGGQVHEGEVVINKYAVAKYGAGYLLALNEQRITAASTPPRTSTVAPPAPTAASTAGLEAVMNRLSSQLEALNMRPATVHATIDASGSTGMDYAGMSRALAEAGFGKH